MVATCAPTLVYIIYNVVAPHRVLVSWVMLGYALLAAGGAVAMNWRRSSKRSFTINL